MCRKAPKLDFQTHGLGLKRKRLDKPCESLQQKRICEVCEEEAHGMYFGALVCLPCKSFFIRCTRDSTPSFSCLSDGRCNVSHSNRLRCQACRYKKCLTKGMTRKEKPETVEPEEGQVLCEVCSDIANGVHFGVPTCEGCKKFFRRALKEFDSYFCKQQQVCKLNPRNRNSCRYCRYKKCIDVGMSRTAIRMGRPKKMITKSVKKVKKFVEAIATTLEDESGERIEDRQYSRVQVERNVERTYRHEYESKSGSYVNSNEYYTNSGSTASFGSAYSHHDMNGTVSDYLIPHNYDYYGTYNTNVAGRNPTVTYPEQSHFSQSRAEGSRVGHELPIYYTSTRQHTMAECRPLVIDTHTHVTISDHKVVSDTRMVVSDPYGSDSGSPSGSIANDSVAGTLGSESNYDVEEDLDVILTSIEQNSQQHYQESHPQTWPSSTVGDVKSEFSSHEAVSCSRFPVPDAGALATNRSSSMNKDGQFWHSSSGYGYGSLNQYEEDIQKHSDQIAPYHEASVYNTEGSSSAQGLGSHMYNSLLMAYNCSNYSDSSDYCNMRQGQMIPQQGMSSCKV